MGRKVDADLLVGTAEIAERIGLSHPEAVHTWRTRYSDFPQPVATLRRVLIWYWPDVEKWAMQTGRLQKSP